MNKILYAFALAGVLGLSSCSDFLDQTSPSEMTAENTYASPYYTNLRVNKLYGGMGQDRTYAQDLSIVWNLNSDCVSWSLSCSSSSSLAAIWPKRQISAKSVYNGIQALI